MDGGMKRMIVAAVALLALAAVAITALTGKY